MSALLPGLGQLWLERKREGGFLLATFLLVLLLWWWARIPDYWPGLIAWIWLTIGLCALSSILVITSSKTRRISRWWIALFIPVAFVTGAVHANWMLLMAGFRTYKMISSSMRPTVIPGDNLVADFHSYRGQQPHRQELILFRKGDVTILKRVLAVEGDTIEGRNGNIFVNDKQLQEPYTQHTGALLDYPETINFGPVYVPTGKLFVIGDNRDNSYDSRIRGYGLVDVQAVQGKPLYVVRSSEFARVGKKIN